MYRDRREMFEGLLKTSFDTEFSLARQLAFVAGLVGFFLLPLAILPVGLAVGSTAVIAAGAVVTLALFAKHAGFSKAVGAKAAYGLLFPVAVGFYLAVVARSIADGLRGAPTVWKGRAYRAPPPIP
jgi:hypothetical protein